MVFWKVVPSVEGAQVTSKCVTVESRESVWGPHLLLLQQCPLH